MKIEVYDADDRKHLDNFRKQDFIGRTEFLLHEVMRAKAQTATFGLAKKLGGNSVGTVTIQAEQLKGRLSCDIAKMCIEGKEVKSRAGLFYKLLRFNDETKKFVPVYQSECFKGNEGNYRWRQVKMGAAALFRDDVNRLIRIELYEYNSRGDHKLLAKTLFKFSDLLDNYKWNDLIGTLEFKNVEIQRRSSFLDYLFGGCTISLAIAIDFTGSNGNPTKRNSLHFVDPRANQYMRAISAVGSILQNYDSDKNIPVFGFGAQIKNIMKVADCFALNGKIFSPEVHGIDGVLDVYQRAVKHLEFAGPTNFAEIIRYMGDMAYWYVTNEIKRNYFVLLMITDGQISDMAATIDEIVRCSTLPMSIVIVGVGKADFGEMDRLDADTELLYSVRLGKYAVRDIVQFVPFNKHAHSPEELAKSTLGELPKQLVDYMTAMKIDPIPQSQQQEQQPAMPDPAEFYRAKEQDFLKRTGLAPTEEAVILSKKS